MSVRQPSVEPKPVLEPTDDEVILDFEEEALMLDPEHTVTEEEARRMQAIVGQLPSATLDRVNRRRKSRIEYEKASSRKLLEEPKTIKPKTLPRNKRRSRVVDEKWNGVIDEAFLSRYGEYCPNKPHFNYFGLPCRQWPLEVKKLGAEAINSIPFQSIANHDHLDDKQTELISPFAKKSIAQKQERKQQTLHGLYDSDDDEEFENQSTKTSALLVRLGHLPVRARNWFEDIIDSLRHYEFLGGLIKSIEGRFGTDLANYYRFSRSLILLNLVIFVFWLSFVMVPQLIQGVSSSPSGFSGTEIFTANGTFRYSIAMSGAYSYGKIINNTYDIGLAYLCVAGAMFFACMVLFVIQMSQRYKKRVFSEDAREPLPFCEIVFRSWDFAIANEATAISRKRTLLKGSRELVAEARKTRQMATLSQRERVNILLIRGFVHFIVLVCLGASLYVIYYVNQKYSHAHGTIEQLIPAITLTLLGTILPVFFSKIGGMEKRNKLYTGRWLIGRSYVLRIASPFPVIFRTFQDVKENTAGSCWMSDLGASLYQLLIINMLMAIVTTVLGDMTRFLIDRFATKIEVIQEIESSGKKHKNTFADTLRNVVGYPNFQISKSTLDALFNTTLVWMGTIFVPVLPAVGCISAVLIFLTKYLSMSIFLKPYLEDFASKSTDLFTLVLLLVTLLISGFPVAYAIVAVPPPAICSPFRVNATTGYATMFGLITSTVHSLPSWLSVALRFTATAGFVVPLFAVLMLFCYYYYSINKTTIYYIRKLHYDLERQRRFKRALISSYGIRS